MKKTALAILIVALVGAALAANTTLSWFSSRDETEAGKVPAASISVKIEPLRDENASDNKAIYLYPSGFYDADGTRSKEQSKTLGYTLTNTSKFKTIVQVNHAGVRFDEDNSKESYTFRLYRLVDSFFMDSDVSGKALNQEKLSQVGFVPYDLEQSSDMYEIVPLVFDAKLSNGLYATTPDIGLRMEPSFATTTEVKYVPGKGAKGYNTDFANVDFRANDSDFDASSNMYFYMKPGASIEASFKFTLSDDWEALNLMGNTYQYSMITLDSSQGHSKNDAGKFVIDDLTAFAIEPVQETFRDTFGLKGDEFIVDEAFALGWNIDSDNGKIKFTKVHNRFGFTSIKMSEEITLPMTLNQLYTDIGYEATEYFIFTIDEYEHYDIDIESDGLVINRNEGTIVIDHFQYTYEGSTATVKLLKKNSNTILLTIMVTKGAVPYFFGGNGSDLFMKIIKTNDGIYAAGGTNSTDFPGNADKAQKAVLVKYNLDGNYLWHTSIENADSANFYDLVVLPDKSIIATGYIGLAGSGIEEKGYIVKFSPDGVPLWTKVINSNSSLRLNSVKATKDGGFLVTNFRLADVSIVPLVYKFSSEGEHENPIPLDCGIGTAKPTCILKNSDLDIVSIKNKDAAYIVSLGENLVAKIKLKISDDSTDIIVKDMIIVNDDLVILGESSSTNLNMTIGEDGSPIPLSNPKIQKGFVLSVNKNNFVNNWCTPIGSPNMPISETFTSVMLNGTELVIGGYTKRYVDDWFKFNHSSTAPTIPNPLPVHAPALFTITIDSELGTVLSAQKYDEISSLVAESMLMDNGSIFVGGQLSGNYNGVRFNLASSSSSNLFDAFIFRLSPSLGTTQVFKNPKVSLLEARSYPYDYNSITD